MVTTQVLVSFLVIISYQEVTSFRYFDRLERLLTTNLTVQLLATERTLNSFAPKYYTGIKNFNCPIAEHQKYKRGRPSNVVKPPTSVHALRPTDVRVIGALGDSITAGNGALAGSNVINVLREYRGQSWSMGGDQGLDQHTSIANILRRLNGDALFGQSYRYGSVDEWPVAQLNAAVPGNVAADLPRQAADLVQKIRNHTPGLENKWKLINIFVGGNDQCEYCEHKDFYSPANYSRNIADAVQILHDSLSRVLVNVVGPTHMEVQRQTTQMSSLCKLIIDSSVCPCLADSSFTNADFSQLSYAYAHELYKLQNSGRFDTRDDFTLVVQPFTQQILQPPKFPSGEIDMSYFAPDCFHFSSRGHDVFARFAWNNMMEPTDNKTVYVDLANKPNLKCPDLKCPFIRTTKNSANCATYL